MFGFLSGLDADTQKRIIENWSIMLKEQKDKENKKKIFKFIRENPPKSFKDIMIHGQIMAKYGNPYEVN
tara:strand:+ start:522 stop:728 length:207 start_codon:yes stop_codon:yes gene_type:complete